MTNLDSVFKSRDITWSTKVHLVKAMVFPVVMYECESWTIKKVEHRIIDDFELWCWRRLLRVPWTARRFNQSILKEISPGCSLESESEVAQLCPTLCDPMDCSLSGSSVHGIFQARMLEWIAISFSRGPSRSRNRTQVSRTAGRRFTVWATREAKGQVLNTRALYSTVAAQQVKCKTPKESHRGGAGSAF